MYKKDGEQLWLIISTASFFSELAAKYRKRFCHLSYRRLRSIITIFSKLLASR